MEAAKPRSFFSRVRVLGGSAWAPAQRLAIDIARRSRVLCAAAASGQLDLVAGAMADRIAAAPARLRRLALRCVGRATQPVWSQGERAAASRPHVVWVVPSFRPGGAERFDLDAIEALTAAGWRVSIIGEGDDRGAWTHAFAGLASQWVALGSYGLSGDEAAAFVRTYLCEAKPDLLVVRHARAGYRSLEIACGLGVPTADIIHTATTFGDWIDIARPFAGSLRGRIVSNGFAEAAMHTRGGSNASDVVRVALGVRFDRKVTPSETEAARRAFGLSVSVPVIGYLGRLAPEKDLLRWLAVAADIAAKHRDAQFLIAGEGPMRRRILDEIGRLQLGDRVRFVTPAPDARATLAAFDVYLLTSRFEGLPIGPLEAMAAGAAVVALDVGAVREGVDGRVGALLAPESSSNDIADAVLHVLKRFVHDGSWREDIRSCAETQFELGRFQQQWLGYAQALVRDKMH